MPRSTLFPNVDPEIAEIYSEELRDLPMQSSLSSALNDLSDMKLFGNSVRDEDLFRKLRDLSKAIVDQVFTEKDVRDLNIARSTITGYNKRCAARHAGLLWGLFLGRSGSEDCLKYGSIAEANFVCDMASKEICLLTQLGYDSPPWLKEIPMLSLCIFRLAVMHVGLRYEIEDSKIDRQDYDEHWSSSKTERTISFVLNAVKDELNKMRFEYSGEYLKEEGIGSKYGEELDTALRLTERVLFALNDVLPIIQVFSPDSDVRAGWIFESGVEDNPKWRWKAPSMHRILYHDGEYAASRVSKKQKKISHPKPVYSLMHELLTICETSNRRSGSSQSSGMRTISKQAARDFLTTVAATYHFLNESGKKSTCDSIAEYHSYSANDLDFVQVRNVQFQAAVLQMWECLKASTEDRRKEIVEDLKKEAHRANEECDLYFIRFPTAGCKEGLNNFLFTPMFICCFSFGGGSLYERANLVLIKHYKSELIRAREKDTRVEDDLASNHELNIGQELNLQNNEKSMNLDEDADHMMNLNI